MVDHAFAEKSISTNVEKAELHCACPTVASDEYSSCSIHSQRPESVLGEFLWKYEMKACEKCNNKNDNSFNNITKWNNNWSSTVVNSDWDNKNLKNNLRNIWNGGEVSFHF